MFGTNPALRWGHSHSFPYTLNAGRGTSRQPAEYQRWSFFQSSVVPPHHLKPFSKFSSGCASKTVKPVLTRLIQRKKATSGALLHDSRAISPWPIGPRTLGPWHIKSQGPKGPNVPRTSGPWPQGPSELRCQGLKVRGPMGQGLFSLFFVAFGTVLIQAYIYRCHIIPPWLGKEHSNRVRHSNHSQAQRALGSRRPHSNRVSTVLPNQRGIM